MKTKIVSALIGIGVYVLAGAIFYGYHPLVVAIVLALLPVCAFFINKNADAATLKANLIWLYVPVTLLLFVSGLAVSAFRVALPYALLLPLAGILTYYGMTLRHKAIAFGIVLVAVLGYFSFNNISNSPYSEFDNFDGLKQHIEAVKRSM